MAAIRITNISPFATQAQLDTFLEFIGPYEPFAITEDLLYARP